MIRIREVPLHHLPAGPPLSARLAVLARRARALLGPVRMPRLGQKSRRLGFGLAFTVLLTGLVLAVPVVSGAGTGSSTGATPVALDAATTSSARSQSEEPVVVMGVDGRAGAPTASSTTQVTTPRTDNADNADSQASPDAAGLPDSSASEAAGSASSAAAAAPSGTSSQRSASSSSASPASSASSSSASSSSASSASRSTPSSVGHGDVGTQLGALVALARSEAGCAGSDVDTGLADLAQAHSAEMKKDGALAALDDDTRGVVANGETDPNVVVAGWLADPEARASVLDCSATKLGVGVAPGHGGPWYTLTLG